MENGNDLSEACEACKACTTEDGLSKLYSVADIIARAVSCPVVITGSLALLAYGLVDHMPHDLDLIVVHPTDEDKRILNSLVLANRPSKEISARFAEYAGIEARYRMSIYGVAVDVFIDECPSWFIMGNRRYNSPVNIINAKKRHSRPKDWLQLCRMADRITSGFTEAISRLDNKRI